MSQNYRNHRHRPYLYLAAFVCVIAAAGLLVAVMAGSAGAEGRLLGLLVAAELITIVMVRRYVTALQDRIILMEMRYRTDRLLSPAGQATMRSLGTKQIAALRFAGDEELPALVERAAAGNWSGDQIKREIKTWVPDWNRT